MFLTMTMTIEGQIQTPYQMPHDDIAQLADASLPPFMSMNEAGDLAMLMYRRPFESIAELSKKEMRLAGLRIDPSTDMSSRARYFYKIQSYNPQTQQAMDVANLPDEGQWTYLTWSPDQRKAALTQTTEDGVHLWVIDIEKNTARQLETAPLNANMGKPFVWLKDGSGFLIKTVPADRPKLVSTENLIPNGPTISENTEGTKAQNRTYQDLLKNKNDEQNFEILAKSAIKKINLNGEVMSYLDVGMYSRMNISPDGRYVMMSEVHRPFSYIVPYRRFPTTYTVYDINGNKVHDFLSVPLMEEMPKGFMATRKGPRDIDWRADEPATLYWAEALDEGDPEKEVDHRDAVYMQRAPFNEEPSLLLKTTYRFYDIEWGTDDFAIAYDYWWNTRQLRTTFFNPSDASQDVALYSERNYQDRYADPGSFVQKRNQYHESVLEIHDNNLYLIGDGFSPEGKFPFVDSYNMNTKKTERIYQASDTEKLEDISRIMDVQEGTILIRLESPSDYPNYYIRNMATGDITAVTSFDNPFAAIQDVHKEVIKYKREDGVDLSATLYLPVGYDMEQKEKMPMLMWAYPREFKDKNTAGQVTSSSNEFTYPYYGSPLYWVNRGYVVLDDAAFPILGEGDEEPNDSFRKQLVDNAKAAIDAVDDMGYIDRERVAVGGHSYGAFMTANLLSHSNLFAAGIARSGAYNRTLTPFGFQAEERNYWEAPEVYYTMSPFMHADKMKTPLLLIHGEADNNSGTYPMQSERYFNALKGLGAPVRLVMLPKESHGYAARESIMHMLWEQDEWLEKYVKNKGK